MTELKGHARFENWRLITPKKEKPYNQNIRIVKRVRKSYPVLTKEENKIILNTIIDTLKEQCGYNDDKEFEDECHRRQKEQFIQDMMNGWKISRKEAEERFHHHFEKED